MITIDVEKVHELSHPRVTYLVGSSTSEHIIETARKRAQTSTGPVMVIFDSLHSQDHVARKLDLYAPLVTPGSYCLVQDGVVDTLPFFRQHRPGPIPAIEEFLEKSTDFEVDEERRCGTSSRTIRGDG